MGLGVYFAGKTKGVPQGLSPNHVAAIGIFVYNLMAIYIIRWLLCVLHVFVLHNEYYDALLRYIVAQE